MRENDGRRADHAGLRYERLRHGAPATAGADMARRDLQQASALAGELLGRVARGPQETVWDVGASSRRITWRLIPARPTSRNPAAVNV